MHFTENVIRYKIGLLNLADELDNVSKPPESWRDAFYRYKEAVESNGVEALIEYSDGRPSPKCRNEEIAKLTAHKQDESHRRVHEALRIIAARSKPNHLRMMDMAHVPRQGVQTHENVMNRRLVPLFTGVVLGVIAVALVVLSMESGPI